LLVLGTALSLLLGSFFQAIFPAGILGYVLAGLVGLFSLAVGLSLVFGGRTLERSGDQTARTAREQAIFALAQKRGGTVTAAAVAQVLQLDEQAADTLLSDMAKRAEDRVQLEVDDEGRLYYVVRDGAANVRARNEPSPARVRVGAYDSRDSSPAASDSDERRLPETESVRADWETKRR
jgi:hypothetical protein